MMKLKLLIALSLLLFKNATNDSSDFWLEISNKTWVCAEDGIFGANMVFLQDKQGKKAIKQLNGSGCCHIMSFIYDVIILNDTIQLTQKHIPSVVDSSNYKNSGTKVYKFIYSENDPLLIDLNSGIRYQIMFDTAHLYKGCCESINISELINDTIKDDIFIRRDK